MGHGISGQIEVPIPVVHESTRTVNKYNLTASKATVYVRAGINIMGGERFFGPC